MLLRLALALFLAHLAITLVALSRLRLRSERVQ
jgi:hypothetical protein